MAGAHLCRQSRQVGQDNLCQRVVEFILSLNTRELVELNEPAIALIFDVDPLSLSRQFEKEKKITLTKYIVRERVYRAFFSIEKNPLVSGTELSAEFGFFTTDIFNREFKNIFLIHPERYIFLKKENLEYI